MSSKLTPPLEPRLQRRYESLVADHLDTAHSTASGIHALPDVATAFAHAQGAWRFFNNNRVTYGDLMKPLLEAARQGVASDCRDHVLVVHDWSFLTYKAHASKKDRAVLSSSGKPSGYEILASLAISDRDGSPLAPLAMSLRCDRGTHCTRTSKLRETISPLDEVTATIEHVEAHQLDRPLVHIIDAEADSVGHFRQWDALGRRFLVRADDRLAVWEGIEQRFSVIHQELRRQKRFRHTRQVRYHGKRAWQFVCETQVVLTRPAQRNRPAKGDRRRIPGRPLTLRLVISEVRSAGGKVLAVWYLLSNVESKVSTAKLALWYYWRWKVEDYFKLLKSCGMQLESWLQQTAPAIMRRLLVASMACVTVWKLNRSKHPQADKVRRLLVRLSGRQMKYNVTHTIPALLAGLQLLLKMLTALESYALEELLEALAVALPNHSADP